LAWEAGRFSPMGILSFLCASVRGKTLFPGEETVSSFFLLSSLINMPCQQFAEVAAHLMKMETTINVSLGLP
jgi:hypothetical protein